MGCVNSRLEKQEAVQRSRDRRRIMKHLLSCRTDLAAAHIAYLQSLRNTGSTLRQFVEVDSVIPAVNSSSSNPIDLPRPPPSPPPPLPPSPPPLPPFSPYRRNGHALAEGFADCDSIDLEDDEDIFYPPPPPTIHGSDWLLWEQYGQPPAPNSSPMISNKKNDHVGGAQVDEEDWAEAKSAFGAEEEEVATTAGDEHLKGNASLLMPIPAKGRKSTAKESDDVFSASSGGFTKDTDTTAVVPWRNKKKTMFEIVKELDDYFLTAAASGKDVAILLESDGVLGRLEDKGNRSMSGRVFNVFSWNRSFKASECSRHGHLQGNADAARIVNHCATLEKLYEKEQRLYKEVRDEEIAKFLLLKKTLLLRKIENGERDLYKAQKVQIIIEELQTRIISLQESINSTCLSISKLRDEELHHQLIELSLGLTHMWRKMYECHQVQNHIMQQLNIVQTRAGAEPTTFSHRQAAVQLETEVVSWHDSFCNLFKAQREYTRALNQWVRLTDCLPESNELTDSAFGIHAFCEEWQLSCDKLPDKVAANALMSFASVAHSVVQQQNDEHSLRKKFERLESRLEKEASSFSGLEERGEALADRLLPAAKHAKLDGMRKRAEEEKKKYTDSIRIGKATATNNLHASLPNTFQALMGFSKACVEAFEGIQRHREVAVVGPGSGPEEAQKVSIDCEEEPGDQIASDSEEPPAPAAPESTVPALLES